MNSTYDGGIKSGLHYRTIVLELIGRINRYDTFFHERLIQQLMIMIKDISIALRKRLSLLQKPPLGPFIPDHAQPVFTLGIANSSGHQSKLIICPVKN